MSSPLIVAQPWEAPYRNNSVWKLPIGSGAVFDHWGDAAYKAMTSAPAVIHCEEYSIPHYVGGAHDVPVWIEDTDGDAEFNIGRILVNVPADFEPAKGGDRHAVFFDTTRPRMVVQCWGVERPAELTPYCTVKAGLVHVTDTRLDGLQSYDAPIDGYKVVRTLNRYQWLNGTVLPYDLTVAKLTGNLGHKLRYLTPPQLTAPTSGWLDAPWPCGNVDYFERTGDAQGWGKYTGAFPVGMTIAIPRYVDLKAVRLPDGSLLGDPKNFEAMWFAASLQEHGADWRDTTGDKGFAFSFSPWLAGSSFLEASRMALPALMPLLRVLLNQSPHSVNGGGAAPASFTSVPDVHLY